MDRDTIGDILDGWEYDPEGFSARIIVGEDGREQLQIRVDLGVLQLDLSGRPDGRRPHGYESLLHYHLDRLEEHRRRYGSIDSYQFTRDECESLRREATQYYQRYLSLHHLGRHHQVVLDTARNLHVCDLLHRHAPDDEERWAIEQFRPYITMMNALSRAEAFIDAFDYDSAVRALEVGVAVIRAFVEDERGRADAGRELELLGGRLQEVEAERPRSRRELLERRLQAAIDREDYETAAGLRDQLQALRGDG